jgi:hypothetical protein
MLKEANESSMSRVDGLLLQPAFLTRAHCLHPDTCSLDELFNAYSIEGFFVQPAESFEIDGLLPSGYRRAESVSGHSANSG